MMRRMRGVHKYVGLVTAVIVVIVSITGMLLIHKKALGLNSVSVTLPAYAPPKAADAFDLLALGADTIVVATKQGVYVREAGAWTLSLPSPTKKLYRHDGTLYACAKDGLYASAQGTSWTKLFSGQEVKALHFSGSTLVIAAAEGIYRKSREGGETWEEVASFSKKPIEIRSFSHDGEGMILVAAKEGVFTADGAKTLSPETLPLKEQKREKIDLQKLITDMHTGELFGRYFYLLMDFTALGLVAISVTGVYLWYIPAKRKKQKREPLTPQAL